MFAVGSVGSELGIWKLEIRHVGCSKTKTQQQNNNKKTQADIHPSTRHCGAPLRVPPLHPRPCSTLEIPVVEAESNLGHLA